VLEILYFDELDSTQKYLIELIKKDKICKKVAVVAKKQTNGIGSRGNSWFSKEGDLLFSFAINRDELPKDLPIQSASIYFGFLIKEILKEYDNRCWLKWPNDIYIENKKCGGVITQIVKNCIIVGIGINLTPKDDNVGYIKLENPHKKILLPYFLLLNNLPKWKLIFSKFRVEFNKSLVFSTHSCLGELELQDAILCEDGSLLIKNERIYSLR